METRNDLHSGHISKLESFSAFANTECANYSMDLSVIFQSLCPVCHPGW
jgi:hypothetical protein